MTRAPETLINEAMTLENAEFLGAPPHERTEDWRGYANGLKRRRMLTRSGRRRSPCAGARRGAAIPRAVAEAGRPQRALTLTVAEMCAQKVSTRRVAAVTETRCVTAASLTNASRAARLLDADLAAWRTRMIGETLYLIFDARCERVRHGRAVIDCAVRGAIGVEIYDHAGRKAVRRATPQRPHAPPPRRRRACLGQR